MFETGGEQRQVLVALLPQEREKSLLKSRKSISFQPAKLGEEVFSTFQRGIEPAAFGRPVSVEISEAPLNGVLKTFRLHTELVLVIIQGSFDLRGHLIQRFQRDGPANHGKSFPKLSRLQIGE